MKKVCILFAEREISLVVNKPPTVMTGLTGKIIGLRNLEPSAESYLAYVDWKSVQAVLLYDVEEGEHGKEAG